MIKFFRRIRYDLMEKNKTGKPALPTGRYFKYAIGEIALVVIGILIALSINNWNSIRIEKQKEQLLLIELYKDAKVDSIFFKSRNTFLNQHLSVVKNLHNLFLYLYQ